MHHYEAILSHLMQAEAQLDEAIKIANDNRGRGMTEDDVVRIAEVRNAVVSGLRGSHRALTAVCQLGLLR